MAGASPVETSATSVTGAKGYSFRTELPARPVGDITLHIKDLRVGMEHEREGREEIKPSADSIETCIDILADAIEFGADTAASQMHKDFATEFKKIYPHTDVANDDQLRKDIKEFLSDPKSKGERILLAMRLGQWQQATLQMATHMTLGLALRMSDDRLVDRHNRYVIGRNNQGMREAVRHVDVGMLARAKRRVHAAVNAPFTLLTESAKLKAKLLEEEMGQEAGSLARRDAERRPHNEWTVDHDNNLKTKQNGQPAYQLDTASLNNAQKRWIEKKFGGRTTLNQTEMRRARNELLCAADLRVELIQLASKNTRNDIEPNMARLGFNGMSYTNNSEQFFLGDMKPVRGDDSLAYLEKVMVGGPDNAITRLRGSVTDSIAENAKKAAKKRLVDEVNARKDAAIGANISETEKKRLEDEKDKEISLLKTESASFQELLEVVKKIDVVNTRISTIESGRQIDVILLLNNKNVVDTVEALILASKQRFDTIQQTVNTWLASGNATLMAQAATSMTAGEYHDAQTEHQTNLSNLSTAQATYHRNKAAAFPGSSDAEIVKLLKEYSDLKDQLASETQARDTRVSALRPLVTSRSLTPWHVTNPPDVTVLETNLREYKAKVKVQEDEKDAIGKPDQWAEKQKKTYEDFAAIFLAEKEGSPSGREQVMQRLLVLERGGIPPAVVENPPGSGNYEIKLIMDQNYKDVKYPTYYLRILQVMFGDDILLVSEKDKFKQAVALMPLADVHRRLGNIGGVPAATLDIQSYLPAASSPSAYNKAMCDAINGSLLRRLIKSYEDDATVGRIGVYESTYKAEYEAITDQIPTLPLPPAFTPAVIADMEMRYYNYHDVADLGIQIMHDPEPSRGGLLTRNFVPATPTDMADLHALALAIDAKRKMRT